MLGVTREWITACRMPFFIREACVSHYPHNFPPFCQQSPWQGSANRRTDLCIMGTGARHGFSLRCLDDCHAPAPHLVTVTRRLGACHELWCGHVTRDFVTPQSVCNQALNSEHSWHADMPARACSDCFDCELDTCYIIGQWEHGNTGHRKWWPLPGDTSQHYPSWRGRDYHDISNIYRHV